MLEVEDLHVTLRRQGRPVHALRGVSMELQRREIVAVVGESGSGKSMLGLSILGLLPRHATESVTGRVCVDGTDMVTADKDTQRKTRREKLGMVFQDPMTSLNPTMRVGRQMAEVVPDEEEAVRLLKLVGVPEPRERLRSFPFELSGGLRQRVMLAMAVAGAPHLIVADEPTTALDVTVQAQILGMMMNLRDEFGCSFLMITHDLGVASQIADRIFVLYGGRLAETGPTHDLLERPAHPYTAGLLRSRLTMDGMRGRRLATLPGAPPDPRDPPSGCPFAPRCELRIPECEKGPIELEPVEGRWGAVACLRAGEASGDRLDSSVPLPATTTGDEIAIAAEEIFKSFHIAQGGLRRQELQALRGVNLSVASGESVAVVGESGSGKSTLLRVLAGLIEPDGGTVRRSGSVQVVFQDAGSSLTPWLTIGEMLEEPLRRSGATREERRRRVPAALELVGLPAEVARARGEDLSGGQRQRVALARATVVPPKVLLCDEPTSALDASFAATVLNLLADLRAELGMAIVFVTHDLAVARLVSDRVAVMYLGRIVEAGTYSEVVESPAHPYTRVLLDAVPEPDKPPVRLPGDPPSPLNIPAGCPFHPRCPVRVDACLERDFKIGPADPTSPHQGACIHAMAPVPAEEVR